MTVYNKKILASILFMLISFLGIAQGGPQGGGEGPPAPYGGPGPPGLPIDDGLIVLFIAAIVFGIYVTLKLSKKAAKV